MTETRLTEAQTKALHMALKRDWPAGEPRRSWFFAPTLKVLISRGLVEERPNSTSHNGWNLRTPIIDLTPAGRALLEGEG